MRNRLTPWNALVLALVVACGPSRDQVAEKDRRIAELTASNTQLNAKIADLEKRLAAEMERPDRLVARAQKAYDSGDFGGAAEMAERLVELHPSAEEAKTAQRISQRGRAKVREASRKAEADAARERKREAAEVAGAEAKRIRTLKADLNRNLNGVGGGFVRRWEWKGDTFVLVLDQSRYQPNSAVAAAMTARAMFDSNGVALPRTLVFRDTSGNVLDSGPFSNVPGVTQ